MNELTKLLLAALINIPRAPQFLSRLILGDRRPVFSGNAKIKLQLYRAGQKLAPISTPARGAVMMTHVGYDDIEVEAPLLAPGWDMTELYNTAAPGEVREVASDGTVRVQTTQDRADTWRMLRMIEAQQMIYRRIEWMLAQQLTTGQIVLQGEGGYSQTIDIGWDNNITVTTPWDDASSDPISDIDALQIEATDAGLPAPNVLVLAPNAASAFVNNAGVQARLKLAVGQIDPIFEMQPLPGVAARRIGYIKELDLMVYSYGAKFAHPMTGVMTPFIPAGSGILVPSAAIASPVYAHGSIFDARDQSWNAVEMYPRQYSREDGHADFFELDSRPVACLADAESWYALGSLVTGY